MASPDVFRSSPLRAPQQEPLVNPSSPDLPPIRDLLSQIPRRPPIRSGSKAKPVPDGAPSTFTSAKEYWKSAQAAADSHDASASVIEIPAEPVPNPRKPRRRKDTSRKKSVLEKDAPLESPTKDQPWKKFKSDANSKEDHGTNDTKKECTHDTSEQPRATAKKAKKKPGTMNSHFQDASAPEKPQKVDIEDSLHLEPAMSRRTDWTPPPSKQTASVIDLGGSPTPHDASSSVADDGHAAVFENLLENYGCKAPAPPEPVAISDEDPSFLKKRKLVEFVNTNDASRSASPAPEKPTKPKAPKKKPRTITELATAAYRPQPEPEAEPQPAAPSASRLNHFPDNSEVAQGSVREHQCKGKGKNRKKPARNTKKKSPPPKPVLLSPDAALKEVSNQDFIFGTSSQLVREQSPSLLRQIQSALRNSMEVDAHGFGTPLNSDAAELPDQKQKLWEAGARDIDGELFDTKIINLADGTPQLPPVDEGPDPFGYFKPEDKPQSTTKNSLGGDEDNSYETLSDILPSPTKPPVSKDHRVPSPERMQSVSNTGVPHAEGDSFETLSDLLPSPARKRSETLDDESLFPSNYQVSVSTDIHKPKGISTSGVPKLPGTALEENCSTAAFQGGFNEPPPRPNYELYTDAQLSKEVTSYGFKPVKRRTAMIGLLDQCWQSKNQAPHSLSRTITTSVKAAQAATSPKRSPGRPRKNPTSTSQAEAQDPPPSAQPVESPKRPRGRPRKNSSNKTTEPPPSAQAPESLSRQRGRPRKISASPERASPKKTAANRGAKATAPVPPRPATPIRKPTAPRTVVEIPDSASENGSDLSASPISSPDQTFSPPPGVDLSVSVDEDTELSIILTPDDEQAVLFGRITEAVTTAPRATDPANPSWYEKILLYDPIVLEDLTSWLNSGQLTRVGHDGEVNPGEVKKWCESKSVCCLWRVNLRGKERKRY